MVSNDLLLFMLKIETSTGEQTPCHSPFSGGITCGPHRGSFAVRDHFCGAIWGSFPAWGSFAVGDHLRSCKVFLSREFCGRFVIQVEK